MKRIFIDPTYSVYEYNKLFDATDAVLNRDDSLAPYINLKRELATLSIELLTYDRVNDFKPSEIKGDGYMSLGIIRDLQTIKDKGLNPLAFYILEPPLIINKTYQSLPYLTSHFEKVFIHNLNGDCYDLKGVNKNILKKAYYPQPYDSVKDEYWKNSQRMNKVVVINGHHRPRRFFKKELYSTRIEWAVGLNEFISVDLFGRGWDRLFSRSSLWFPYLRHYKAIKEIYRGPCGSKLQVMSQYDFALCFENLIMDGYITEKIFDCFYSGVIPIYRGGNDISQWIPSSCYIDLREFKNAKQLADFLLKMDAVSKQNYRNAGKDFVASPEGRKYSSMMNHLGLGHEKS